MVLVLKCFSKLTRYNGEDNMRVNQSSSESPFKWFIGKQIHMMDDMSNNNDHYNVDAGPEI